MNCRFFFWLVLPALLALSSCGSSKETENNTDSEKQARENTNEKPVEVAKNASGSEKNTDLAPAPELVVDTPDIPVDVPAVIPVPVAPVIVPPPPPLPLPLPPVGGIIVADHCEDFFCGNSKKDDGEECDDGNDDNDDSCDNFCRKVRCGNRTVEGIEECDDPDHIFCTDDCTLVLCGNGEIDEGENCDPPNDVTKCNFTCLSSVCGNGIVEFGEECDDDNAVEDDGCNSNCELNCTTPVTNRRP